PVVRPSGAVIASFLRTSNMSMEALNSLGGPNRALSGPGAPGPDRAQEFCGPEGLAHFWDLPFCFWMEALCLRGRPDSAPGYAAKITKNFLIRSWISQVPFHPIGKKAADPASRVTGSPPSPVITMRPSRT